MKRKFFKNKGFTLFELLAVLAILSIIAAIAVPRVMQTIKNARIEALKNNMQLIANSVQRYVTEKEIGDHIGGMFVINPTEDEGDAADSDGIYLADNNGVPAGTQTSGTSVYYIKVDSVGDPVNGIADDLKADYIEGGIPAHIRVIIYADTDKVGHIEVTYGNVDDGGNVLLWNGIKPKDLDSSLGDTDSFVIPKTFEFNESKNERTRS